MIPPFKKFLRDRTLEDMGLPPDFGDLGIPFHVQQGGHSAPNQDDLAATAVPFEVSQGGHSIPKKDVKESIEYHETNDGFGLLQKMGNINPHLAENTDDVQHMMEEHYSAHENPHFSAMQAYTSDSSDLNTHLFDHYIKHPRFGHHGGDRVFGDRVGEMDRALSHKPLHVPLTVMSGLKKNPGLLLRGSTKNRLFHPAYMSTTIHPPISGTFASPLRPGTNDETTTRQDHDRHFLKVDLEPGQHGFFSGRRSFFDNEYEFTLPRGSVFHVHRHEVHHVNSPSMAARSTVHIWHATVLNPTRKLVSP